MKKESHVTPTHLMYIIQRMLLVLSQLPTWVMAYLRCSCRWSLVDWTLRIWDMPAKCQSRSASLTLHCNSLELNTKNDRKSFPMILRSGLKVQGKDAGRMLTRFNTQQGLCGKLGIQQLPKREGEWCASSHSPELVNGKHSKLLGEIIIITEEKTLRSAIAMHHD